MMRTSVDGPERVVIDPNVLSPDGSIALSQFAPSPDGKLLRLRAVARWIGLVDGLCARPCNRKAARRHRAMDQIQRPELDEGRQRILLFAFSNTCQGKELESAVRDQKLYYHTLGTPQAKDRLIYERPDHPRLVRSGGLTDDGRYLQIHVNIGTDPHNRLYVADLGDAMHPNIAAPVKAAVRYRQTRCTCRSATSAPRSICRPTRKRRSSASCRSTCRDREETNWKTIVPEAQNAIDAVGDGRRIASR